jgi:hypothetical protein
MSAQPRLHAVNGDSWIGEPDRPPTALDPATDSAAGGTNPPSGGATGSGPQRVQKQRSDRSLPTDRLGFEKQVEALEAIAQLSGGAKKPVTAGDVSAAIGLAPTSGTGGLSNKFFRDSGWIVSAGRGNYAATDALMEYFRHVRIDPQDPAARRHLVEPTRASWYWQALEPVLSSGGGARKSIVLLALSKAAGATEHTTQLETIVSWLEWLSMVRRDGDLTYLVSPVGEQLAEDDNANEGAPDMEAATSIDGDAAPAAPAAAGDEIPVAPPQAQAPATPEAGVDTSALISFNFSVRITAEDASKLSPEQLQSVLDFAEKLRG